MAFALNSHCKREYSECKRNLNSLFSENLSLATWCWHLVKSVTSNNEQTHIKITPEMFLICSLVDPKPKQNLARRIESGNFWFSFNLQAREQKIPLFLALDRTLIVRDLVRYSFICYTVCLNDSMKTFRSCMVMGHAAFWFELLQFTRNRSRP